MATKDLKPKPTYDFAAGPDYEHGDYVISQKQIHFGGDVDRAEPTSNGPTPMISLAGKRFALMVVVSVAVLVGVMVVFVHGVVIDTDVRDELGSSKNVDGWVETYQVINGFFTAAFGMVMEGYFMVFIAVAATFLSNVRWYPGDDPRVGRNRVKLLLLWAFQPGVLFVLNIAISAAFVGHKSTGVLRVFLPDDLVATNALGNRVLNATTAANLTSMGNGVSVLDTILRGAVRQKVVPFKMDPNSSCVVGNTTNTGQRITLPSVKEVRATAVLYGFPPLDWNADAMPFGMVPTHSVTFELRDINASTESLQTRFEDFQKKSNVTWLTTYELFLQGKLLFERSVSDANATAAYVCSDVDGLGDVDSSDAVDGSGSTGTDETAGTSTITAPPKPKRRRLQDSDATEAGSDDDDDVELQISDIFDVFEDGPDKGKRRCFGALSTLQHLDNITDPSMHSVDVFVETIKNAFIDTTPQIEPESMNLTIETYDVNPEVRLTSMTLDMPYFQDREYRNTSEYCDKSKQVLPQILKDYTDNTTTKEDLEEIRALFCEQENYPFLQPRATCGHRSCIFLDQSGTLTFKKQLQLMPYLTECSTAELKYDSDFLNFFPQHCVKSSNAVFLYGLGSYMTGDSFDSGYDDGIPYISKPKRHVVLTFAKLEWRVQDLSKKFQADCGVNSTTLSSRCLGLLHDLENVTVPAIKPKKGADVYRRVLVLGQDQLPAERMDRDFRNPVQLVSLNSRPFYYKDDDRYYEWEYLDRQRFNTSDWPETIQKYGGLGATMCSPLVDSYITQLEENHLFIDDPRQPLYTSALFYLFQNAAVKTVKLTKNATTGVEILQLSVVGTTAMKGDLEQHDIKFSIPLPSLISTFVGLGFMVLLAVMAVVRPTPRFKMAEDATENVSQQYVRFQQEDEYPSEVFDRGLKMPTGERVAIDDYVVDSLTLHHMRDEDKKMYL